MNCLSCRYNNKIKHIFDKLFEKSAILITNRRKRFSENLASIIDNILTTCS